MPHDNLSCRRHGAISDLGVYCEGLFTGRALVPGVGMVLTEPAVMGGAQALNQGLLDLKSFTVSAILWKHIWKQTQTPEPDSSQPFLEAQWFSDCKSRQC